jgi:hypothetical protein
MPTGFEFELRIDQEDEMTAVLKVKTMMKVKKCLRQEVATPVKSKSESRLPTVKYKCLSES